MKVTCSYCGATNAGLQDHCLICRQPLPARPRGPPSVPGGDRCPACNAAILPGTQFCRRCGTAVSPAPSGKCPSCGSDTGPAMKFCRTCGHTLAPAPKKGKGK